MPLLIDGHNLIGRMQGISLADPDDEVELVRRIRRYCYRSHHRATVVFDQGLPAGPDLRLSKPPVEVIFAPVGSTADRVIRGRLRRARDPRGLIVVSSDHEVQAAARARGARVMGAEAFAARLTVQPEQREQEKPEQLGSVEEWLSLFTTDT